MVMTMATESLSAKVHGVVCICVLFVAASAVNDVGKSQSQHNISQLSAAAADVCAVDSHTAAIHCVNRSLHEMPASLPADTRTLNLSYNLISQVTAEQIDHLSLVQVISLQYNLLSTISVDAFVNCTSLHSLYLDHNLLTSVRFVGSAHLQELHVSFNRIATLQLETGTATELPLTLLDLSFNSLKQFDSSSLSSLQNVQVLNLSHNLLDRVELDGSSILSLSNVNNIDVASNRLASLKLCNDCYLYHLLHLNLSSNRLRSVDSRWCQQLPNLTALIVSHNPISSLASGTFGRCLSLHTLQLSNLFLRQIDTGTFVGLNHLRTLRLDHNRQLVSLQRHMFKDLSELVTLDLSGCSLTALEPETLQLLPSSLLFINLDDNPWQCDCEAVVLTELRVLTGDGVHISEDTLCVKPSSVRGKRALNVSLEERDECRVARPLTMEQTIWAHMGTDLLVNCTATGDHPLNITWFSKHYGKVVPVQRVHADTRNAHDSKHNILVLTTGSLYIRSVSRASAGLYYCVVSNEFGSGTMHLSVRLNSDAISITTLYSIIFGLLSAAGFFLVAVVIGIARYLAYVCSKKERRKRKSIRAVLESIQDYKCAQFDRFSAYRTAKMDQLSAFKSAKIEQLSAYRDARIDKLRTYKQATVASILTHIERMREHYAAQTARIKENCAQQAERLRERYSARRGRFKNYRSHQVDRMRENYAAQAARIREYGMIQMSRLREQYKTQQQHVLKLVELLDVGSCVSGVIEAECMKAESMIFDADIAFDFEAQPAHANELSLIGMASADDAVSESSRYVAASDSDLSVSSSEDYSITCVADVVSVPASIGSNVKTDDNDDDIAGVLAVASDVLRNIELGQQNMELDDQQTAASQLCQHDGVPPSPLKNVGQVAENASEQEMVCLKHSSSHEPEEEASVELAGYTSNDVGDPSEQMDCAAIQDTSC